MEGAAHLVEVGTFFFILIVILLVRPEGIFGRVAAEKV